MRCIHIYRGAPQLGGIKLHKHFSWFHTAKWGVHRIAPRTVLHVIRIVLTMELQPLKTVELHGWVCLPDSLTGEKRVNLPDSHGLQMHVHTLIHTITTTTHTHTRAHTHTPTRNSHRHTHTHTHTHIHFTHKHMHTHTNTLTRAHTNIYTRAYIHTQSQLPHIHTHTHVRTRTHTHTYT